MSSSHSVRGMARELGVSIATISRALRGFPGVGPETRRRVASYAKAVGYEPVPLVGQVLAQIRRSSHVGYTGTLALARIPSIYSPAILPFEREVLAGATSRARELGYRTEYFELGPRLNATALARIMRARGHRGLILQHHSRSNEMQGFVWSDFPAVEIDHGLAAPALHSVCIDHYDTMMACLGQIGARGYRRPGLILEYNKDARLQYVWSAAFRSFQFSRPEISPIPILEAQQLTPHAVVNWFRMHRPDVVVGHKDAAIGWLAAAGSHVPEEVGFFCLNWNERETACAGLDHRPSRQGAAAADAVAGLIVRNERGVPDEPVSFMIQGVWVDGPTLPRRAPQLTIWQKVGS